MTNYSAKHWAIKAEKSAEEVRSFITNDLLNSLTPDYSRVENRSVNTEYTASVPGFVSCYARPYDSGSARLLISSDGANWIEAFNITGGPDDSVGGGGTAIVGIGDRYKFTGAGVEWVKFYPMKGV